MSKLIFQKIFFASLLFITSVSGAFVPDDKMGPPKHPGLEEHTKQQLKTGQLVLENKSGVYFLTDSESSLQLQIGPQFIYTAQKLTGKKVVVMGEMAGNVFVVAAIRRVTGPGEMKPLPVENFVGHL